MMTAVTTAVLAAAARRATVAAPGAQVGASEGLETLLVHIERDERAGRRALRSEEREGRGQVRFEKTQDTVCGFVVGTRVVAKQDIETKHRTVAKKGHLGTVQGRQEGARGVPVLFDSHRQVEIVARDTLQTAREAEAEAETERVVKAAGAAGAAAAKEEGKHDTEGQLPRAGLTTGTAVETSGKQSEVDSRARKQGAKAKKRKKGPPDIDALQGGGGVWETATKSRQKKSAATGSQLMSHQDLVQFVLATRDDSTGFWGHWCALAKVNGVSEVPSRVAPEVLRQLVVALNAELRLLPDGRLVDPAQEVDAGGRAAARGHPLSPVAHAHAPHQRGPRQEPHGGGQQRGITKQQSLPSAGAGLPAGTAPAPAHPKAALGWRSKGGGPTPIVCPAERDAVPLGAVAAAGSTRCARRGISSGLGGAVFPAVGTLRSTTRAPPSSTSTPPDASPTLPFTAASPGSTVRDASHALEPDSPRSPLLSRAEPRELGGEWAPPGAGACSPTAGAIHDTDGGTYRALQPGCSAAELTAALETGVQRLRATHVGITAAHAPLLPTEPAAVTVADWPSSAAEQLPGHLQPFQMGLTARDGSELRVIDLLPPPVKDSDQSCGTRSRSGASVR
eukprot:TRINITY_DN5929_c0_g1_i1.p1 TRINITY_DN5929_c0_g1~~TRINITY_DN5929_c0_g1_i1.p1  ORF type:complete len:712 (+),score=77.08 TRINITY_DN5929_c0_g1_i1:278-2137(+)